MPGFSRSDALARLATEEFDVLVIGGGITGCGVALDAATRGLSVALVEREDFASGTSSKSSKLVHGGLRYLQQKEIRLVYDALYERQRALRNAPHLVRVLPFLIPVLSRDGLINPKIARALGSALWMYDLTGGARIRKLHRRIDKQAALAHMPTLREPNIAAAYLYYDAQTDDARYTLTLARTAAEAGAVLANHAAVTAVQRDAGGRARGVTVTADGRTFEVRARTIVNAAGVFSDDVREMDEGTHPHSIRPAKGIHITVPWEKVRNDIAAIVPVPKDRRSIFVVPWGDLTYIGTTDTDYDGPIDDPQCTPEDVRYLLDAMNIAMAEPLTEADIVGTWAGLRPLVTGGTVGQKTADLSRRHKVRRRNQRDDHDHRRQAHDVPEDGAGHDGRGAQDTRPPRPMQDQEPSPARRDRTGPGRRASGRSVRIPGRRCARTRRRPPRPRPTARARAAVPPRRGDLRRTRGDGHDARRRPVPPHPSPIARPRRHRGCRRRRCPPDRTRPRLGRGPHQHRGRDVPRRPGTRTHQRRPPGDAHPPPPSPRRARSRTRAARSDLHDVYENAVGGLT